MQSFLPVKASDIVPLLGLIPHPEGGFFLETFRSGVEPMSTRGTTQRDCVSDRDLVTTHEREGQDAPDTRRHCMTSIYWMPTLASPLLYLCVNMSDHVHYYHGGKPFEYLLYRPDEGVLDKVILGPDLEKGHQLQVCVRGGTFKCGRLVMDPHYRETLPHEYCLLGEAVGPGFDICDFRPVVADDMRTMASEEIRRQLSMYMYTDGDMNFDGFYNEDELKVQRTQARTS